MSRTDWKVGDRFRYNEPEHTNRWTNQECEVTEERPFGLIGNGEMYYRAKMVSTGRHGIVWPRQMREVESG